MGVKTPASSYFKMSILISRNPHLYPKICWLIEEIDDSSKRLAEIADFIGYPTKVCGERNCYLSDWDAFYSNEDWVVTHTSIQTAQSIMRSKPWLTPWLKQEMFQCRYYYPFFGDFLFNKDYVMIPFGEVLRLEHRIFDVVGVHAFFMRPSSGLKCFTGQVFYKKDLAKQLDALSQRGVSKTDLVVISSPKNIFKEYRYIIGNRKIITSSEYSWNPNEKDFLPAPEFVDAYVRKVLSETSDYNPDPVWVLDVAVNDMGQLRVLEVGSFSTAGLYGCDMVKIVQEVSKIAWEQYSEIL